jgi:hypothetical protein
VSSPLQLVHYGAARCRDAAQKWESVLIETQKMLQKPKRQRRALLNKSIFIQRKSWFISRVPVVPVDAKLRLRVGSRLDRTHYITLMPHVHGRIPARSRAKIRPPLVFSCPFTDWPQPAKQGTNQTKLPTKLLHASACSAGPACAQPRHT